MSVRAKRPALVIVAVCLVAALSWWQSRERQASTVPPTPITESAPPAAAAASRTPEAVHDLGADEARGGHTLARHVGRSDDQLRERLDRERGISAASTYTDRAVAERTVARALAGNRDRIDAWLARSGNRPNLALDYRGGAGDVIGRSLMRGRTAPVPCIDALVVLRWTGRGSYVLTSYPEARR